MKIYFDYTATTAPKKELLDLYQQINNEYWYNTEALYNEGVKSHMLLDKAAKVICDSLKVTNKKVLFTSGATEANNTAIYGICKPYFNNPKHIITTVLEHASVLNVFKDLEKRGFKVTYLKPNNEGIINIDELKESITSDTILVSIMWVNNIIGSVQPINKVINVLKDYSRIKLHVDAVQGFSKIEPNFNFNDIDLITLSGHKLNGIKGTGLLLYNNKLHFNFLQGGHQQDSIRPGTVDLAGAVVMAKTIQLANTNISTKYNNVLEKYTYLVNNLKNEDYLLLNISKYSSPYILSLTFKNIKGETVLHALETKNILVGTGSACNSKSKDLEPTLVHILTDSNLVINTIRISLSFDTKIKELDELIKNIKEIGRK